MTADTRLAREDGTIVRDRRSRVVPVRTIAASIGMVLLTPPRSCCSAGRSGAS
jgi:hypothetical protein